METMLVGIAGGTGSGKTTLTRHLKEHFGGDVTVIGHDSYYKLQEGKTYEERARVNYDHPSAFDTELLIQHLADPLVGGAEQPLVDAADLRGLAQQVPVVIGDAQGL